MEEGLFAKVKRLQKEKNAAFANLKECTNYIERLQAEINNDVLEKCNTPEGFSPNAGLNRWT